MDFALTALKSSINGLNVKPINAEEQLGKLGGLTVNPTRVAGVETTNSYGISIPQNHSYTTDESGNQVALGQDGVGLAHRNSDEFNLHLIA